MPTLATVIDHYAYVITIFLMLIGLSSWLHAATW